MKENNHNSELNNEYSEQEELLPDEYGQSEEEPPLTKEEILKRSRNENINGDERDRTLLNYGWYVTFCIGLLFLFTILFVNLYCLNKQSYELLVVIFAMGSVTFLWQGIFGKKLKAVSLFVGICNMFLTVIYLVRWIQILKV